MRAKKPATLRSLLPRVIPATGKLARLWQREGRFYLQFRMPDERSAPGSAPKGWRLVKLSFSRLPAIERRIRDPKHFQVAVTLVSIRQEAANQRIASPTPGCRSRRRIVSQPY
jgi:hypothetical protein